MNRTNSKFKDHPRITWFGQGGTVAYVDYTGASSSYFIGNSERGGFKVLPPNGRGSDKHGFSTFDAAVEYALAQV